MNIFLSSLILTIIVTVMVWVQMEPNHEFKRKTQIIFRTIIISFILILCFQYFFNPCYDDDVMKHMIKTKPNF